MMLADAVCVCGIIYKRQQSMIITYLSSGKMGNIVPARVVVPETSSNGKIC